MKWIVSPHICFVLKYFNLFVILKIINNMYLNDYFTDFIKLKRKSSKMPHFLFCFKKCTNSNFAAILDKQKVRKYSHFAAILSSLQNGGKIITRCRHLEIMSKLHSHSHILYIYI